MMWTSKGTIVDVVSTRQATFGTLNSIKIMDGEPNPPTRLPSLNRTKRAIRIVRVNFFIIQWETVTATRLTINNKLAINWPASSVWVFIAQPGEHSSDNAEATGLNPVEAPKNFFSGYFRNCLNCDSLRWSHTHFICIPTVHIISFRNM